MMQQNLARPKNAIPVAPGFNPTGLTDNEVHPDWRLLEENEPIQPGDGFMDRDEWISYECRPDIFRGNVTAALFVSTSIHGPGGGNGQSSHEPHRNSPADAPASSPQTAQPARAMAAPGAGTGTAEDVWR